VERGVHVDGGVEERHVEFSVDVVDDSAERESTRLQRRDTPHHLKNKRVNAHTPPPSQDDEAQTPTDADDRVRRLLARQIGKLCESSLDSDHTDTAEVSTRRVHTLLSRL